jgi:hypothetical protein
LEFVPRRQLGQCVPQIGDRKFASIVQKFLHEYGEISIYHIEIVAPYEEDPSGSRPRVRTLQNHSPLRFEMAEAQMPANITNFKTLELRFATHFFCYNNCRILMVTLKNETHKWTITFATH